jgi:hypothetical protein
MRARIHPLLRIGALVLLAGAWAGFAVLLIFGLARVRQFPGFQNFLVFIPNTERESVMVAAITPPPPTMPPAVIIVPTVTLIPPAAMSGRTMTSAPPQGSVLALPPQATAQSSNLNARTSVAARVSSYPTRCQHSVETRLHVGARGYTSYEPLVRLRPSPGGDNGTRLAGGTAFETIGEPRCADLWHPWNNYLWWPVRLTSGSLRGQTGWLPESMISEGRTTILLFPG